MALHQKVAGIPSILQGKGVLSPTWLSAAYSIVCENCPSSSDFAKIAYTFALKTTTLGRQHGYYLVRSD